MGNNMTVKLQALDCVTGKKLLKKSIEKSDVFLLNNTIANNNKVHIAYAFL